MDKLLLISQRDEDQTFAREAALSADLEFLQAATVEEGVKVIDAENPAIILADVSTPEDYQNLVDKIHEKFGLMSQKINANAIHFLSSENIEKVQYLIESPIFGHYICRHHFTDPKEDGKHYGRIIRATLMSRSFGLKNLMKADAKIQTLQLKVTNQKQQVVEAVKSYLIAAKFQTRMATVIANAVDETLMNAMFDAPVDEFGKQILASTSRSVEFKLEGKHAVELQISWDGQYIGITASDLFGSLNKTKLMSHISKIYTDEEYKVKTSVAGAGIGLATVFRSGGSFFFVSEADVRTEVTVFFKRCDSFREFRDQFRFISTQFYF